MGCLHYHGWNSNVPVMIAAPLERLVDGCCSQHLGIQHKLAGQDVQAPGCCRSSAVASLHIIVMIWYILCHSNIAIGPAPVYTCNGGVHLFVEQGVHGSQSPSACAVYHNIYVLHSTMSGTYVHICTCCGYTHLVQH